jgi:hypothetical protein
MAGRDGGLGYGFGYGYGYGLSSGVRIGRRRGRLAVLALIAGRRLLAVPVPLESLRPRRS